MCSKYLLLLVASLTPTSLYDHKRFLRIALIKPHYASDILWNISYRTLLGCSCYYLARLDSEGEQQKEEDEDNLEIEYEYGYDQHDQNNYGKVIFLEGEIEGMETYHRVTIEMVQLNEENEDEE